MPIEPALFSFWFRAPINDYLVEGETGSVSGFFRACAAFSFDDEFQICLERAFRAVFPECSAFEKGSQQIGTKNGIEVRASDAFVRTMHSRKICGVPYMNFSNTCLPLIRYSLVRSIDLVDICRYDNAFGY